jgi:hypothetical protein
MRVRVRPRPGVKGRPNSYPFAPVESGPLVSGDLPKAGGNGFPLVQAVFVKAAEKCTAFGQPKSAPVGLGRELAWALAGA